MFENVILNQQWRNNMLFAPRISFIQVEQENLGFFM